MEMCTTARTSSENEVQWEGGGTGAIKLSSLICDGLAAADIDLLWRHWERTGKRGALYRMEMPNTGTN